MQKMSGITLVWSVKSNNESNKLINQKCAFIGAKKKNKEKKSVQIVESSKIWWTLF